MTENPIAAGIRIAQAVLDAVLAETDQPEPRPPILANSDHWLVKPPEATSHPAQPAQIPGQTTMIEVNRHLDRYHLLPAAYTHGHRDYTDQAGSGAFRCECGYAPWPLGTEPPTEETARRLYLTEMVYALRVHQMGETILALQRHQCRTGDKGK